MKSLLLYIFPFFFLQLLIKPNENQNIITSIHHLDVKYFQKICYTFKMSDWKIVHEQKKYEI